MKYSGEIIEAFEAYSLAAAKILSDNGEGHRVRDYLKNHVSISDFAAGWNASRAALVVELPKTDLTGAIGIAHKAITKRCAEAITKTGVRVK